MSRPVASLSLDLDNQWSYMKTHGDEGWEDFPSYLDVLVPRVLDFLKQRDLTITFFIVGQDAALEKNRAALKAIAAAGHEIGNHSFHHEPWLHLYSEERLEAEFETAEEAIEGATGVRPQGFRGPGFSLSPDTLRVLKRRGYQYDTSTFPTFIGPLARIYYFLTSDLKDEDAEKRKLLFGSWREGFRPIKSYSWDLPDDGLVELPVTTFPGLRVPIHVSYLTYLSTYSPWLARRYFGAAIAACRLTGVQPTLLLHPLDFLGRDDVDALAFFPAMGMESGEKLERVGGYLDQYTRAFDARPIREHVAELKRVGKLRKIAPHFPAAS